MLAKSGCHSTSAIRAGRLVLDLGMATGRHSEMCAADISLLQDSILTRRPC